MRTMSKRPVAPPPSGILCESLRVAVVDKPNQEWELELVLPPRSIVVLEGQARYEWARGMRT